MRRQGRTFSNVFSATIRGLALAGLAVATFVVVLAISPGLLAQSPDCVDGPQEAEHAILHGFTIGVDSRASNGSFIHVPDGAGSSWTPSSAYMAQFCFEVEDEAHPTGNNLEPSRDNSSMPHG